MLTLVRQAAPSDTREVVDILGEAAGWLKERGMSMWQAEELSPDRIAADVAAGLFFIGERDGQSACTLRFQLSDPLFWPDIPEGQSAFIHRLALRRRFSGCGISSAVLRWAAQRAHSLGRSHLRLDCEASRPGLRAIYEGCGFVHHSDRQVGPYFVARYELDVLKIRDGQSPEHAG
jgi:GNAT superfamily N-acetyltransferase